MTGWTIVGAGLALSLLAGCGDTGSRSRGESDREPSLSPDQRDAQVLGREVLDLVDRAVDYRGSHRGRPAGSFRQMGIDTLTETTVRRLVNVGLDPLVTVAFRKPETRAVTSCRGDSQILEEATLNGGRFTLMCTTQSGAQRPIVVGHGREP